VQSGPSGPMPRLSSIAAGSKSSHQGTNSVLRGFSAAALQETQGDMTMDAIGGKRWGIAEGHIPSQSSFTDRNLISHETACILNVGDSAAHVALTIFFADRDPAGPYRITVPARRTLHLRFNDLTHPSPVPDTIFRRCSSWMCRLSSGIHGSIRDTGGKLAVDDGVQRIVMAGARRDGSARPLGLIPHKRKFSLLKTRFPNNRRGMQVSHQCDAG